MRRVILNVATGNGHFQRSQERLRAGLDKIGETNDRILRNDYPPGCLPHNEQPFAFKPYIFLEARDLGYTHALWLDSTCVALRPLDGVWDMIDADGAFFWDSGFLTGQWTSDACLRGMGCTREEAWQIPMIQASAIGLKFDSDRGFLDQWIHYCELGLFRGPWTNKHGEASADSGVDGHRHDQSVASILAHRLGFPFCKPPLCVYANPTEATVIQNLGP